METCANEKISHKTEPTLQRKKLLLPIDKYAAREGISRDLVEACGKMSIVQLRKYKGKTFVVDVPLSPYYCTPEITTEPTQPIGKTTQANNISESAPKIIPDEPAQSGNMATKVGKKSQLVNKMSCKVSKITDKPVQIVNDEPAETKEKPESAEITKNAVYQLGFLTEQAGAKHSWQITTLLLMAFFLIALFGCFWFYLNRNIQLEKLEQARAIIQMTQSNSREAAQQIETLQSTLKNSQAQIESVRAELANYKAQVTTLQESAQQIETLQNTLKNSKAQIERARAELANYKAQVTTLQESAQQTETLQNTLKNSKAQTEHARAEVANYKTQVTTLQNELTRVRQNLKTIQERNARAVERLNEHIRKLSAQPPN
ncbi:MAG: ATP-binding protein [Planctomycetota bacterium]|jgi:chemotaxis protein histidine kinase CheA